MTAQATSRAAERADRDRSTRRAQDSAAGFRQPSTYGSFPFSRRLAPSALGELPGKTMLDTFSRLRKTRFYPGPAGGTETT
jgi:hypothetical protein